MEASGPYYLKLATFLHQKGVSVSVINPLVIRRFSQMRMMRTKTDKKDAVMIAEYGKTEMPKQWEPEEGYVLELRQMMAYVEQLSKQKTSLIRQQEAFKQNPKQSMFLNKSLKQMVDNLESELNKMEIKMEKITKEHHQELSEQLQSIPGIGKKTSMQLIVLSGGFTKFENAKQLTSYVGLSPRIFESGTSVKGRAKYVKWE